MNCIPKELDISGVVGEITTQICVSEYDIQFTIGKIWFKVYCPIKVIENGVVVEKWNGKHWPGEAFGKILNVNVVRCELPNLDLIAIHFENATELQILPTEGSSECLSVGGEGVGGPWFIA